jgi:hypothetical protein
MPRRKPRLTAARDTGWSRDYYRLESDGLKPGADVPLLLPEVMLGDIEGQAATTVSEILAGTLPDELSITRRYWLALFLAFQIVRGEDFRAYVRESTAETYREAYSDISDQAIAARLTKMTGSATPEEVAKHRRMFDSLASRETRLQPTGNMLIALAGQMAKSLAIVIATRPWRIYHASTQLITCDQPVAVVGGPGESRRQRAGIGLSAVLLFPLTPNFLLTIFNPYLRLDQAALYPLLLPTEVAEVNLEIASWSTSTIYEHPRMQFANTLTLPPHPVAATMDVFHSVEGDGRRLLRTSRLSRWAHVPNPPPWPVSRWYGGGWEFPPEMRMHLLGAEMDEIDEMF